MPYFPPINPVCEVYLVKNKSMELISYLNQLLKEQVLTDIEIQKFIESLSHGRLENPIDEKKATLNSALLIHREEIDAYLSSTVLDQSRLLSWAENILKDRAQVRKTREVRNTETKSIYTKMGFHRVNAGKFKKGFGKFKVDVELTNPMEVMSTPVTQKHWLELMGENSSHFKISLEHPVEEITWYSALVFANRLSEKDGLEPVYDFSQVVWKKNTKPENGSLELESGEVRINNPEGDIYLTHGFRLPTIAEQEFLLRNRGQSDGFYYFSEDVWDPKLSLHAWFSDNSNGTTQPVAELVPLLVDGKDFFDLIGNVSEWSQDIHGTEASGINPQDFKKDLSPFVREVRSTKRGSYGDGRQFLGAHSIEGMDPNFGAKCIGFRLYRTLYK